MFNTKTNAGKKQQKWYETQKETNVSVPIFCDSCNSVILTFSGKHPVSALVELCNKRRWASPDFQMVHEGGPDHKKNFLFRVR